MYGMLSAAILVLVFVLVTVACGGTVGWLYRTSSPSSDYVRSPKAAPAEPVADTRVDLPAPQLALEYPEGHILALPPAAEPLELEAPPRAESPERGGGGDESDDAQIYVLDNSHRSGR
jgi:hypothetical protein